MLVLNQKILAKTIRMMERKMVQASFLKPSIKPNVEREERLIETNLGNTRVITYRPNRNTEGPLPVFVNMHGGGFVMGSAELDDAWCPVIADRASCLVVNIDYHLAPEYKFPAAIYECYDILKWLYENPNVLQVDNKRIAVGGHSAGGNLAAALCLLNKEREQIPLVKQILNYPPLDLATDPDLKFKHKKAIPPRLAKLFNESYLKSMKDAENPLVSPVYAEDLEDLPPALIITAEFDSLADEADYYASQLEEAGVTVKKKRYMEAAHAFTHTGELKQAEEAWHLISDELKEAFS
nr:MULTISPECIES: alpha/beta hydrolase [Bacillaceae]